MQAIAIILSFVFLLAGHASAFEVGGHEIEPYPIYNSLLLGSTMEQGSEGREFRPRMRMFLGGGLKFDNTVRAWCDTMSEYEAETNHGGGFLQFSDNVCGVGLEQFPHLDLSVRVLTSQDGLLAGPFAGVRFWGAWTLIPNAPTYVEVDPSTDGKVFNLSFFVSQNLPFRRWMAEIVGKESAWVPNARIESFDTVHSDGSRFGDVFAFIDDVWTTQYHRMALFGAWQWPAYARDHERVFFGVEFRPPAP